MLLMGKTQENKMTINYSKNVVMHFCISSAAVPSPIQLTVGPNHLQVVQSPKLLGVATDDKLTWKQYVTTTVRSVAYRLYSIYTRPSKQRTSHQRISETTDKFCSPV
ncbi:hypothetical protein E2C01_085222 [Portunus trituberculatus]|uniref:Uncharacterized protein n=1 Tax=Portunus trituberculatus TaxID=210409 RepID=A0A5B7J897_PORTR|nr:hypothetical protein [Portunus trituberculatus]